MITKQIIAYYIGVLITSGIIFFVLKTISVYFLEAQNKKLFLRKNQNANLNEIEQNFKTYFQKIKTKLHIFLVFMIILIYLILHK